MALALRAFICEYCGQAFQARKKVQRHCSKRCLGYTNAALQRLQGRHRKPCSVSECIRISHSGGVCITHWRRMNRSGSFDSPALRKPDAMSIEDWFFSKVDTSHPTGCWVWTGKIAHKRGGYGIFHDPVRGKSMRAHHYLVLPLPTREESGGVKMEYDHLCRNVACVRPDHLEMVTAAENRRRAHTARIRI